MRKYKILDLSDWIKEKLGSEAGVKWYAGRFDR